jgi:hypothetical protein
MSKTPWYTKPLVDESTRDRSIKARSHPGQAHFGGTGPAGKTCRECGHFEVQHGDNEGAPTTFSYTQADLNLKPGTCAKFSAMMRVNSGPSFPHSAAACRYFEANPNPPAVLRFEQFRVTTSGAG